MTKSTESSRSAPVVPDTIRMAAAVLAEARATAHEAAAALQAVTASRDAVAGRIATLEAERAEILAARRTGHNDDAVHRPRLMLLAADLDDLAGMLTAADADVLPVRQAAEEANRRLSSAEQALVDAREEEVLNLTKARADELGALLLQAITSIDRHRTRKATSRHLWYPSKELAGRLHALDLQRV